MSDLKNFHVEKSLKIDEKEEKVSSLKSLKTSKPDGLKIIQNMEEVLNSVKKKHKHRKHNCKKNSISTTCKTEVSDEITELTNKNPAGILTNINALAALKSPSKENILVNSKRRSSSLKKTEKLKKAKNSKIKTSSSSPQKLIRHHFPPTPKKDEGQNEVAANDKKNIKINAFEFMMNARNRSIGINSPGKEIPIVKEEISVMKTEKVKRKILLEELAEKKSNGKRKLDDESRGEYIEYQLDKRAKRLKTMLTNLKSDKKFPKTNKILANKSANEINRKPADKLRTEIKRKSDGKSPPELKKKKNMKIAKKRAKRLQSSDSEDSVTSKNIKTAKKRTRLLSSLDSEDSIDSGLQLTSKEDGNFLAKLSSPIKKRDSLLGYFSKTISPSAPEALTVQTILTPTLKALKENDMETPKTAERRGRSKKAKKEIESESKLPIKTSPVKFALEIQEESTPIISRPRRACVGKVRYDYDLEKSPTKLERKSSKRLEKTQANDSDENQIIILDNSLDESPCERKSSSSVKLAPLFVKSVPKPNIDPEILKARQEFLMSGVPDKMKQEMARQKAFEQTYEFSVDVFPKISHCPEWLTSAEDDFLGIDLEKLGLEWLKELPSGKTLKPMPMEKLTDCRNKSKNTKFLDLQALPSLDNKREIVKNWKNSYEKFPTYKCYNQLREKYRFFGAMDTGEVHQQFAESFMVTRRSTRSAPAAKENEDVKPPLSAPNGELLFTEKYKPLSSREILVNLTPLNSLKEFLLTWQIGNKNGTKFSEDSQTDFDDSNSSSTINSIVLIGPRSSGKTNAVFALADELNFNVLEINAGMKRTGKKLLQELQEATQSHQVRKSDLLKKSFGAQKKQPVEESSSSDFSKVAAEKMSLILVEDADVIFDQHDNGFIDAIYQLSSISKRPVVIMANDLNCPHLSRLIQQNCIAFKSHNAASISKFLSILALLENCPIDLVDIISLYLFNSMDLRKTILEMQFFIQSGGDRRLLSGKAAGKVAGKSYFASPTKRRLSVDSEDEEDDHLVGNCSASKNENFYMHKTLFQFYTNSQNFLYQIPFPVDFNLLWINLSEIFRISNLGYGRAAETISPRKTVVQIFENAEKNASDFDSIVEFYENVSVAAYLKSNDIEDRLCVDLKEEISHNLIENSIEVNLKARKYAYNLFDERSKERVTITSYMPANTYLLTNKKSFLLDYESSLRSICRSEKLRSSLERRGSRFYHYLRNSCTKLNSFSTEIFDSACSILAESDNVNIIELTEN